MFDYSFLRPSRLFPHNSRTIFAGNDAHLALLRHGTAPDGHAAAIHRFDEHTEKAPGADHPRHGVPVCFCSSRAPVRRGHLRRVPEILHWSAGLILASSSLALGGPGPPPELRIPAGPQHPPGGSAAFGEWRIGWRRRWGNRIRGWAPGILHWNAGLMLTSSFRVSGDPARPRRSCGPG